MSLAPETIEWTEDNYQQICQAINSVKTMNQFINEDEVIQYKGKRITIKKTKFSGYGRYVKEKVDLKKVEIVGMGETLIQNNYQCSSQTDQQQKIERPQQLYSSKKNVLRNIDVIKELNKQQNNIGILKKSQNFLDELE